MCYYEPNQQQEISLKESTKDFINHVWPVLKKEMFPDKELITVEAEQNILSKVLDIECGADFIVWETGKGCKAISSRIQWAFASYNSFTIRSKRCKSGFETELEKKKKDASLGFLTAGLTIQAYLEPQTKKIHNIGIINTQRLYDFLDQHPELIETKSNKDGSSDFIIVKWSDILAKGFSMKVIEIGEVK